MKYLELALIRQYEFAHYTDQLYGLYVHNVGILAYQLRARLYHPAIARLTSNRRANLPRTRIDLPSFAPEIEASRDVRIVEDSFLEEELS
jgi:hypothetical protein